MLSVYGGGGGPIAIPEGRRSGALPQRAVIGASQAGQLPERAKATRRLQGEESLEGYPRCCVAARRCVITLLEESRCMQHTHARARARARTLQWRCRPLTFVLYSAA